MATHRIAAELTEISKNDLRKSWDDEGEAVLKAAEAAASAEATPPLIADVMAETDGAEPPSWRWSAGPAADANLFHWEGALLMSGATPYADGRFELAIELPSEYPSEPPVIKFKKIVYHPGIAVDGSVRLAELQVKERGGSWDAAMKIRHVMDLLGGMFAYPESYKVDEACGFDAPGRPDLAKLIKEDKTRFIKNAKRDTEGNHM